MNGASPQHTFNLAVVGMAARYGGGGGLEAYARAVYAGAQHTAPPRTPAAEEIAEVAGEALRDAALPAGTSVATLESDGDVGPALAEARRILAAGEAGAAVVVAANGAGVGAVALTPAPAGRAYAEICAGVPPAQIGLLECTALPPGAALLAAYRTAPADHTCALGSAAANLGRPSGMASLIRAALSLHRRTLPALPGGSGPEQPERWEGTPFYAAPTSRPWFAPPEAGRRYAAVALGGDPPPLVLTEAAARRAEPAVRPQLTEEALRLFPIAAGERAELEARLERLRRRTEAGGEAEALAREAHAAYQATPHAPYALALVARDRDALLREIALAQKGVARACESGKAWTTPRGSAFTAQPLGGAGIAFVYPGAFNTYPGVGRDLFQHFPALHEHFAPIVSDLGRSLAERRLYPRSLAPLAEEMLAEQSAALANDPIAMIEAGTTLAIAYTAIVRDVLGVRPRAALGYSLGESSMLWAMGVWQSGDAGSDAWRSSPLFRTRLFGPKDAVREAWGSDAAPWESYILKAPVDEVRAALAAEPRVYLTHANLADEAVIAGEPEGCRRVIAALGCHKLRVPFDAVIHNPAMRSEYERFVELSTRPVAPVEGVAFYSAAEYRPLALESAALARAMAQMTCTYVDFPRLVDAAYAGGARLFVELGPLGTCTRWIGRILRERPHDAVAIDRSGAEDYAGVLTVAARLVAHRAPVNLAPLYGESGGRPAAIVQAQPAAPVSAEHHAAFYENLARHAARTGEGHRAFLEARGAALRETGALIGMQVAVAGRIAGGAPPLPQPAAPHQPAPRQTPRPALFDERAIRAFARGDPERCFPEYAIFRGKRVPRLPNGDLLLLSRVVAIEGERGRVIPGASLEAEYDLPANPWFYRNGDGVPYAIIMEVALQPCGFLAAYSGSTLPYPEVDFHFRNLDGEGELLRLPDLRGRTITNRVQLLSSTALKGIILQNYDFELSCGGAPFYRGTSSFGYFTPEALANQAGLGGDPPWLPAGARAPATHLARRDPLDLLDEVRLVEDGGRHGKGYVRAGARVRPADWFFDCHFYQDPVMPGSLGVEAMRQALRYYAEEQGLVAQLRAPVAGPLPGSRTVWKYRGQITPQNPEFHLEVHVCGVDRAPGTVAVIGEGSLWKGDTRIYEVRDLAVQWKEGSQ